MIARRLRKLAAISVGMLLLAVDTIVYRHDHTRRYP
jgi:hypothetical protein